MSKHPFRWDSLAFGLFFLAVLGQWAVWQQDLLTPRELSLAASGILIVLGVLGVVATLVSARTRPATDAPGAPVPDTTTDNTTTHEGAPREDLDPKP